MRPLSAVLAAAVLALAVAACGESDAPPTVDATAVATPQDTARGKDARLARTFAFVCDRGDTRVVVRLEGARAYVYPGETETPVRLDRLDGDSASVAAGSYGRGNDRLAMRGDSTRMTITGKTYDGCVNRPDEALWEYARLNGVDFRAVGHGPAWTLDVHDDSLLVFVTDSGRTRLVFPAPPPDVDARALTGTYRATAAGHRLDATLHGRACVDDADGTRYETTVAVRLDSADYAGCGRSVR